MFNEVFPLPVTGSTHWTLERDGQEASKGHLLPSTPLRGIKGHAWGA